MTSACLGAWDFPGGADLVSFCRDKPIRVSNARDGVILLLDEPGLTLHGKAQLDLQRFFRERLAPHHQIIFSTHSPFMVPANDLVSVRVLQDSVEHRGTRRIPMRTKVVAHTQTQDADALFPLQAAVSHP